MRSGNCWRIDLEQISVAGRSTQSFSTTWDRSRIICISPRNMPGSSGRKGNRRATIFLRSTIQSGTISHTRSWDSSQAQPKRRSDSVWQNWNKGDNGILDLSKAYRLKPGSGWLIGPGILHAPGSLCTYEPQWGSDVFSMFQSLVEGREVPRALLVKNIPPEKHFDLDFILSELDWEANVDPLFQE